MLEHDDTAGSRAKVAAGTAGGSRRGRAHRHDGRPVQTWVNLLAFLLQAFVVSRIFKYIGVRGALFILPVDRARRLLADRAAADVRVVMRWTKILENSTDYSIQNTTRHALFLPTSREAKYKAKQAIDSFFVRAATCCRRWWCSSACSWR